MKITHDYWWENDIYYRRSIETNQIQIWNGKKWEITKPIEPDLEVISILDSINDFFKDRELTKQQAAALDAALARSTVKVAVRELPARV